MIRSQPFLLFYLLCGTNYPALKNEDKELIMPNVMQHGVMFVNSNRTVKKISVQIWVIDDVVKDFVHPILADSIATLPSKALAYRYTYEITYDINEVIVFSNGRNSKIAETATTCTTSQPGKMIYLSGALWNKEQVQKIKNAHHRNSILGQMSESGTYSIIATLIPDNKLRTFPFHIETEMLLETSPLLDQILVQLQSV